MTIKVRILIAAVLICGLLMIINMLRKRELELVGDISGTSWKPRTYGRLFKLFRDLFSGQHDFLFGICILADYYFFFNCGIITSYSTSTETGADCGFGGNKAGKRQWGNRESCFK